MPVDLSDADSSLELVWVSPTNSTTLDISFRRQTGEIAFMDSFLSIQRYNAGFHKAA